MINKMKQLLNLLTFNTYCRQSIFLMVQMCYNKKRNKKVDCKCKLNKIYQATISVEYTLSRKVSNSSSGL